MVDVDVDVEVCHGSDAASGIGREISVETWGLSDPTDWISLDRLGCFEG